MLGEAITLDRFADLFERMEVRSRADTGLVLAVSGWHPDHGECVLLQHFTEGAYLIAETNQVEARHH